MRVWILTVLVLAALAAPSSLLAQTKGTVKVAYQVNITQVAQDTYRVDSGDLPSGTTIYADSCVDLQAPSPAAISWFGPGFSLNQILFPNGSSCPVVDIVPEPFLATPT